MTAVAEPELAEATPLYDLGAERCVIGAMLLDPATIADITEVLPDSGGFYEPKHRLLFDTITALHAAGLPTSPPAVVSHLAETGQLGKVGGAPYVHTIVEVTPIGASGRSSPRRSPTGPSCEASTTAAQRSADASGKAPARPANSSRWPAPWSPTSPAGSPPPTGRCGGLS